MSKPSTLPSLTSRPVTLSASAPGTLGRYALAVEAVVNLIAIAGMLLSPDTPVRWLSADPSSQTASAEVVASGLVQWFAALIITITVPILSCIPNTKRALESRPTVYVMLLGGELALMVVMLWQASMQKNEDGMSVIALLLGAGFMVLCVLWRVWVLWMRPEWMGAYVEGGEKGE